MHFSIIRLEVSKKRKRSDDHLLFEVVVAEKGRRASFLFLEYSVEVADVVEAAVDAYLGYRH